MIIKPSQYTAVTRNIKVSVRPSYLDASSAPAENHFVWAYQVRIENLGRETVQLRTRHWQITDARGDRYDVKGDGVVGETPILEPGDIFEYTSGTPLPTPSGIMMGSYQMENEIGDMFDITIPAFSLDSPYEAMRIH